MASFFNVGLNLNPFSTRVGQKIEEATDSSHASENWALILEVCDLINSTEDGPKDAVRAIKKRLQQNAAKNYKTVLYTLTLLEACVKNCYRKFHVLVCSKDFVQELVKLIGPKNDPPMIVQEKVLSLIQSWADAFHNEPDMLPVVQIYKDLKAKGIEFPMTDLDAMAPIHTPQKTVPSAQSISKQPVASVSPSRTQPMHMQPTLADAEGALKLSPEQLAKLRSELDIVQENMTILNEMLTELVPGREHPSDRELLVQLHNTCKAMQERLVELISQLANDEVTAELLRINDLLNNLFLRYSRYEKNRSATLTSRDGKNVEKEPALIDLGDDGDFRKDDVVDLINDIRVLDVKKSGSSSTSPSKMNGEKPKNESEFDMFAQSRNVTYESSKKGGSTYEDNLKPNQMTGGLASAAQNRSQPPSLMHSESDFDEMAAWLGEQAAANPETDSLTSSEFDRFLAERVAAVENLPSSQQSPYRNTASQRTNKQPSKDMYAL